MGPQNAIMGGDSPTELPQTKVHEDQLELARKLAAFSQTQEFKELKDHLESRIEFYQQYLPNGTPIPSASKKERDEYWPVAILITTEFKSIIRTYEQAAEEVRADELRKNS